MAVFILGGGKVTLALHGSTHQVGGSDVLDLRGLQGGWLTADVIGNRPAASKRDRYFYATDSGALYWDNGFTWVMIAAAALGDWVLKLVDTVYQAATDGVVMANNNSLLGGSLLGLTDSSTPPTVVRRQWSISNAYGGITFTVKKNDYWKVTYPYPMLSVWWIPSGL